MWYIIAYVSYCRIFVNEQITVKAAFNSGKCNLVEILQLLGDFVVCC